jgi:hypothetical protein
MLKAGAQGKYLMHLELHLESHFEDGMQAQVVLKN